MTGTGKIKLNIDKVRKGILNPGDAIWYIMLKVRGSYYRIKFFFFRKKVKIGKNFIVSGRADIKGPGSVTIGDNVKFYGRVTPWTYSKKAEIVIGSNVILDGTRFGCRERIEIGDDCLIGECRILDTDFHSVYPDVRNDPNYVLTAPIKIGENVWMTMNVVISKGVTIGEGATITPNSVVNNDVPERCIFGGNPGALIKKVPGMPHHANYNSGKN